MFTILNITISMKKKLREDKYKFKLPIEKRVRSTYGIYINFLIDIILSKSYSKNISNQDKFHTF